MSKIISIILFFILLMQLIPVYAAQTVSPAPDTNRKDNGFNWTLALIVTSIISLIISVIAAVKQANKRFPKE